MQIKILVLMIGDLHHVFVFTGANPVVWRSKKQPIIFKYSIEVEYRALIDAATEVLWLKALLREIHMCSTISFIWCDNLSTVALTANPILHARTKHIELDMHFIREKVLTREFIV